MYYAAWAADADPERLREAAAIANYVASSGAVAVTAAAIQAHGGVGSTWEGDPALVVQASAARRGVARRLPRSPGEGRRPDRRGSNDGDGGALAPLSVGADQPPCQLHVEIGHFSDR